MEPPDKKWQYLLFAAEPYETIIIQGEHLPWSPLIKSDSICCLLLNHETISFKVSTPHGTPW